MTTELGYSRRDWRVWALGLLTVCLIGVAVATILAGRAARDVRRVEAKDRDATRQAAYRLCTRNRVDRAFAHSRVRAAAGMKAVRQLERTDGLPILDCGPNLKGDGARPMSPAAQEAFVRRWERRRLSLAQLGICPNSRIASGEDPATC